VNVVKLKEIVLVLEIHPARASGVGTTSAGKTVCMLSPECSTQHISLEGLIVMIHIRWVTAQDRADCFHLLYT